MKGYFGRLLRDAISSDNIDMVRALYMGNPSNSIIKFEYARMLVKKGDVSLGRELLCELLDTKNRNYALLELGILEVCNGNIPKAKEYFNELLTSSYVNDKCCALLELGRIESFYGDKNMAYKYFNKILSIKCDDYYTKMEISRLEAESGNIDKAKMILNDLVKNDGDSLSCARTFLSIVLFNNHEFDDLIKLISDNKNIKTTLSILLYLGINFNVFFNIDYKNTSYGYTALQLLDYDEYVAIDHIMDRHVDGENTSLFNPDVDVHKLFNDIKSSLTLDNRINKSIFNDIYSIYYPNIGIDGRNYLRVVTLPNSLDILTMYPIINKRDMILSSLYDDGVNISRVKRK